MSNDVIAQLLTRLLQQQSAQTILMRGIESSVTDMMLIKSIEASDNASCQEARAAIESVVRSAQATQARINSALEKLDIDF